jgi:saccharopine dehydrogenase (NAD+, L-glutamate forming)
MERRYDIVLFGATGFTGRLTARYLAVHAPAEARLALAGRDLAKLERLRSELAADRSPERLDLLVADAADAGALAELAGSSRLVISTVGPYLRHGEPLVAACVQAGTDYVDISGEWEFVDRVYLRHHEAARRSGARLVHSCGYESIPFDLGALFTVREIGDQTPIALRGFGLAKGSFSGGTYQSALQAIGRLEEGGQIARQRRATERHAPDGGVVGDRRVRGVRGRLRREPLAGGWALPAPTVDPQHVLRSARLHPAYGPDFSYSNHFVTGSLLRTSAVAAGFGVVMAWAQVEPTRNLLRKLRAAGGGPSAEKRARSSFRVTFVADLDHGERRMVTEVRGGDPGYDETAKMVSEAAICLAFDDPHARGGGQWTPALACGERLIERLIRAGIQFSVIEHA